VPIVEAVALIVVGALAGAGAKWLFDRLAAKETAKEARYERVVAARHQGMEAAHALQVALLNRDKSDGHKAVLAAAQAVSRLITLRDVRGANRLMIWHLAMTLERDDDEVAQASSDYLLHINDPLDKIEEELGKAPLDHLLPINDPPDKIED
jgi:enoyl-CoA hydratase/carnithine racemase